MINKTFFIFVISSLFSCSNNKSKALIHYTKAKELFETGDIINSSSQLEMAISADSSNLDFRFLKAKILEETNNYEQALILLEDLRKNKYKSDTIALNLASCYFGYALHYIIKKSDTDKANEYNSESLKYYNEAIDINTRFYSAYIGKQKTLHNLGRYDEALIVLNTALNLYPDSITLICNRGVEKLYLGDHKGSMTDLNKAIQTNKLDSLDLSVAYRFRALLFKENKKIDLAINDLNSALIVAPNNELVLGARGDLYLEKGLNAKACEDYRKAFDLGYISIYTKIKEFCGQ